MNEYNNTNSNPEPNIEPPKTFEHTQPAMPQNTVAQPKPPVVENPTAQNSPQPPVQPQPTVIDNSQVQAPVQPQAQQPVQSQPPQYRPPQGAYQAPYGQPQPPIGYGYNPQGYRQPVPQPAPKEKMSGGLKAFIIISVTFLVSLLICFIAYISINAGGSRSNSFNQGDNGNNFNIPGEFGDFTQPTQAPVINNNSDRTEHKESDARKSVAPDFKGIDLKDAPAKANENKSGSSYTYNSLKDSIVGVMCYDTEDTSSEKYATMGTGIIVTSDGYIVTNSHVIDNSRTAYAIKVVTDDKKEYKAGVVGYDSRTDLAVLKIDAKNLPVATFGDSQQVKIAQDVLVIGNPLGIEYQNSVTKGIVSALDRYASTRSNVNFIQVDAAINPGNSGGALCNMYGQVIGITSAKIALETYEGMGFAIPSTTVKKVVDDIIRYSYVKGRVKIGIVGEAVQDDASNVSGIRIQEISKGGPMDGTGAQPGDVITKVDGKAVSTFAQVYSILEEHKPGDKVRITIYRSSTGKSYDVTATLQADENN